MSSRAMPSDSKRVICSSDWRPATLPVTTSESSATCSQSTTPLSTGEMMSPHSIFACSRSSTTSTSARLTATSSSSRRIQWLPPAAFMCVPGRSHLPSKTGLDALVMMTTISASDAASSAVATGTTGMSRAAVMSDANDSRRSAVGLNALTAPISLTAHRACSWVLAW